MHTLIKFTVAVAVAGLAHAQSPQPRPDGVASGVFTGTGLATTTDGAIAGGRDWEARFTASQVEFVPVLGPRAPRTLPLRLRLQAIQRGGDLLHAAGPDCKPQVRAGHVVFERAPGLVERYDVRSEGLEQSFVFATPPAGTGDLVVTIRTDTELQPQAVTDGIAFTLPGIGGVHVGGVTGIDAKGARIAGSLRLSGRDLELVLPGDFVAHAAYPLVLDPLVGTQFDANGGGYDDSESDVAYDATNDRFLVVWRRTFSATNSLIRAQMLTGGGALSGGTLFLVPSASSLQAHPRVCSLNANNRFVIVWEESPSWVGPRDVYATTVLANDGSQSTVVGLLTTAADENSPCVAGDGTIADDEALLVWQDANIRAQQLTVSANGTPGLAGANPTIANAVFTGDLTVSKSGGATGRAVIAWTNFGLLSDSEVWAQAITKDAGLIGSPVQVTSNAVADRHPSVDGDGNRFLLAWQQEEGGGGTFDVACIALGVNGSSLAATGSASLLAGNAGIDELTPDVACLGSKFGVFWTHAFSSFFDDVYGSIVNVDCTTCGARFVLGGLNRTGTHNYEFAPRCVGRYAGSIGASPNGMVVFSEGQNVPPFEADVIAQRFNDDELATNLGGGCGAGGTNHSSCMDLGNANFAFTLSAAAAGSPAFLMLGYTRNDRTCGGCTLVPDVWTGFVGVAPNTNAFGNTQYGIAVPADPTLQGFSVLAQWAVTGTNCFVSGFDLSNAIRATIQ